jgi:multicomponent Na+:H+ antiporter subunit E
MSDTTAIRPSALIGALPRALCFLVFWLILAGIKPIDVLVGALTATVATWVSLRLLPAGELRVHPLALARLVLHFLRQSIVAGVDVAWRALDPRLPLKPGFIACRSRLVPGTLQSAFCTMMSLLPGTLPCEHGDDGALLVHCLDVTQPVAEQMAAEEALFVHAVGGTSDG